MIKNYIIYEYLKKENDVKYIAQSRYLLELENILNVDLKNGLKDYITKDIDNIKHLLKDKYIIFEEIDAE